MSTKDNPYRNSLELPEFVPLKQDVLRKKIEEYQKTKNIDLRNEIVDANLRLVAKIASQYARNLHIPRGDLFQEGSLGLINAVEDFDASKNVAFSTFATAYIRNSIFHYLSHDARMIKTSTHDLTNYRKISQAEEELAQKLHREVKDDEICDSLGGALSLAEIARLRKGPALVLSLDSSPNDKDGEKNDKESYTDRFADESLDPREAALDKEKMQLLFAALAKLQPMDRDIVLSRHCDKPKTLQQLADKYHVTAEAIRQRESRALGKLRQLLKTEEC